MSNPSSPDTPPNDLIILGTIVRPHGLKGEVKVSLSCSGIDRLKRCKSLRLVKEGRELKPVSVTRAFEHSDGDVVVRLPEVEGLEEAEGLRGAQLAIPVSEREELPEDAFYVDDLVGLKVFAQNGQELGVVAEVMDGLANGVLVIQKDGAETLLPMIRSVVLNVDVKGRRITVEVPEVIDGETAD